MLSTVIVWSRYGLLLVLCLGVLTGPGAAFAEDEPEGADEDAPNAAEGEWASYTSGLHRQGISSLQIHPKATDLYFAHVHGMGAARSSDGGKTWTAIMAGIKPIPDPRSDVRLSLDPGKPRWLYMVVEGQIYVSQDRGDTWANITTGALASYTWDRRSTANLVWEVRVNPSKGKHLLIGTFSDGEHHGGLYQSSDGGKTWKQTAGSNVSHSGLGEPGHDTFLVRVDPKTEKNVIIAGRDHCWASDDRGNSFEPFEPGGRGVHSIRGLVVSDNGKNIFLGDARGVWHLKGFGKKWGKKPAVEGNINGVFLDSRSGKRLYAIFADKGPAVSDDSRHRKWTLLGGESGYADAEIMEIVAHPKEKGTTFFLSPATGLHVSKDGGATITQLTDANIPTMVPGLVDVNVHPGDGNLHLALTEHGVVFCSEDDGVSWNRAGRIGQAPGRIIPDPERANTWYATGNELLRSTNSGNFWDVVYTPENPEETVLDVRRVGSGDESFLLAVLQRSGALITSDDDGKTWVASTAPPISDGTWVTAMDVEAGKPDHVLIATTTLRHVWSDKDMNGGVFQTLDGGATWQDMSFNIKPGKKDDANTRRLKANWNHGRFVAVDEQANLVLYGADGGGLFARALSKAEGEKSLDLNWYNVTPAALADTNLDVVVRWDAADGKDSNWAVQLSTPESESPAYAAISGAELRALYDAVRGPAGDDADGDKGDAAGWHVMSVPSAILESLRPDPRGGGRLIGADAEGGGVFVFGHGLAKPRNEGASDEPVEVAPTAYDPPDGMWGFSASADQEINVWTLRDGKRGKPLRGHNAEVYDVVLSSDETVVASAGADSKVRIWDASSLEPIGAVDVPGAPSCVVFDSDSSKGFVGLETWQISVFQKESLASAGMLEGHRGAVLALAVADDANVLYSGSKDGSVKVWGVAEKKELLSIDFGAEVFTLAVAADGSRIYVGGASKAVKVYGPDGTELGSVETDGDAVVTMRLGPEGEKLYVGGEGGVRVLDAADLSPLLRLEGPEKAILCLTLSVDGVWLFAGDEDNGLWLWQTNIPKARWANAGAHAGAVFAVAVTPDQTEMEPPPPPAAAEDAPGAGDEAAPAGDGDEPAADGVEKDEPKKEAPGAPGG